MSLRMWRSNGPIVSVEGKKGFFDIAYGAESESQKLDVWLPDGEGPFPAIISIHGGGYIACDKRNKEMIAPMLAGLKKGFAVIGLNYRLSLETKFPNPVKDVKQGIRFIRSHAKEWNIDPDKLITWGGSAGGYMTLMSCLCAEDTYFDNPEDPNLDVSARVACGVAWYPQTDFRTCDDELKINSAINKFLRKEIIDVHEEYEPALGNVDESDFPYHNTPDSAGTLFLGDLVSDEKAKLASPIYRINKNMSPVFVQHGSADQILPMQQSIRFALDANDLCGEERVKLELIPDAIHSSVLFETEKNIGKCLAYIEGILSDK